MSRVENEPASVHPRRGRSEWCVLSLCTGQGLWGCFNILLNVVFLLTLAGEVCSPERLLPARLLAKFLGCSEGRATAPTAGAAPDDLADRTCSGLGRNHTTLPLTAPDSQQTGRSGYPRRGVSGGNHTLPDTWCVPTHSLSKQFHSQACALLHQWRSSSQSGHLSALGGPAPDPL